MFMFKFMGFLYLFVTVTAADYNVFRKIFYGNFLPSSLHDRSKISDMFLTPNKKTLKDSKICENFDETEESNYIVMFLFKTSGRFMGMGGIIDRKTVLTAKDALKMGYRNPEDVRVLAGYFSPWWGKNAQVRNCRNWIANDYDVVLVEIYPAWRFGGTVNSIGLKKNSISPLSIYVEDFLIHGVRTDSSFNTGDYLSKRSIYFSSFHTLAKTEECEQNYDVKSFNSTIHICFNPNETFCWGCIGSPVIGLKRAPYGGDLVGVVVKSYCYGTPLKVMAVNVQYFEPWIVHHSIGTPE